MHMHTRNFPNLTTPSFIRKGPELSLVDSSEVWGNQSTKQISTTCSPLIIGDIAHALDPFQRYNLTSYVYIYLNLY
jgi:hypothetical protein